MSTLTDIAAEVQRSEVQILTVPGDRTPLCQQRSNRYALGIAVSGGTPALITTLPGGTPGFGIQVNSGDLVWFTIKDHGSLAQAAWFDSTFGGGVGITVHEIYLPKE